MEKIENNGAKNAPGNLMEKEGYGKPGEGGAAGGDIEEGVNKQYKLQTKCPPMAAMD